MSNSQMTLAEQVAHAVHDFQQQRTGHAPQSVTVVLSEETLVVTLYGALSPAEKALSRTPEGATQVRDYHRELFQSSLDTLREEIQRITGIAVREAAADVESATGAVMQIFTTGTIVQVFQLASGLSTESWSSNENKYSGNSP